MKIFFLLSFALLIAYDMSSIVGIDLGITLTLISIYSTKNQEATVVEVHGIDYFP